MFTHLHSARSIIIFAVLSVYPDFRMQTWPNFSFFLSKLHMEKSSLRAYRSCDINFQVAMETVFDQSPSCNLTLSTI